LHVDLLQPVANGPDDGEAGAAGLRQDLAEPEDQGTLVLLDDLERAAGHGEPAEHDKDEYYQECCNHRRKTPLLPRRAQPDSPGPFPLPGPGSATAPALVDSLVTIDVRASARVQRARRAPPARAPAGPPGCPSAQPAGARGPTPGWPAGCLGGDSLVQVTRDTDWEGVRLHVVTGKGGTGKTTVAAALALALASSGGQVLLMAVEGKGGAEGGRGARGDGAAVRPPAAALRRAQGRGGAGDAGRAGRRRVRTRRRS